MTAHVFLLLGPPGSGKTLAVQSLDQVDYVGHGDVLRAYFENSAGTAISSRMRSEAVESFVKSMVSYSGSYEVIDFTKRTLMI